MLKLCGNYFCADSDEAATYKIHVFLTYLENSIPGVQLSLPRFP